mmetsp:Transcript_9522/g.21178  ORF Transcript_9522/g.21178 Transcript_9522/m.21178 type:complete len:267 (-) Transcript_9522:74-874(-)
MSHGTSAFLGQTVSARSSASDPRGRKSSEPLDKAPFVPHNIRLERRLSMLEEQVKDNKHKLKEVREEFAAQLERVVQEQLKESAWILSSRQSRIGEDFSVSSLASLHEKLHNSTHEMQQFRNQIGENTTERTKLQHNYGVLAAQLRQIEDNYRNLATLGDTYNVLDERVSYLEGYLQQSSSSGGKTGRPRMEDCINIFCAPERRQPLSEFPADRNAPSDEHLKPQMPQMPQTVERPRQMPSWAPRQPSDAPRREKKEGLAAWLGVA